MKKPKRKTIKNKLDKIFAQIIHERGTCCERCGKQDRLQCSHIFSRGNLAVRWDLDNAFLLCAGCHLYWWHKNPIEAAEFTKKTLGERTYQELRDKANSIKKWTDQELNSLYLDLCKSRLQ